MTTATGHSADALGLSVGTRLDRLPTLRFHHRLLWVIGIGLFVDGFDLYLSAGVSGALVKQGIASLSQVASLAVATAVGLAVGGLASGVLADRFGRRPAMRWTILLVTLGSLSAAAAPSIRWLVGCRFVTALGLGGETVLGYAVLGEFLPPMVRGRWLARMALLANGAMPIALLIGFFLLPQPSGYRWMLALPGIAAIGVWYARRSLTESPRWLASRGFLSQADAVVTNIEQSASNRDNPPRQDRQMVPRPLTSSAASSVGYRGRFVVAAAVNIAVMTSVFGFVSWLPTFFAKEGKDIATSALFAGVMSVGSPIGVLIGMAITDRLERKWGIVACSILTVLLGGLYALSRSSSMILISGFLVVTAIFVTGTLGLIGYVPELFPTASRMRGVGASATVGRIVVMAVPFVVVRVFSAAGQSGVIAMISAVLLLEALIVGIWGVRTRGQSLEVIAPRDNP
jgi:MFS transporter, putative metabolite:H+ symporter